MRIRELLHSAVAFEWDDANTHKILAKHDVAPLECEEVFFNTPLLVVEDAAHSAEEPRGYALGQTNEGRTLFIAFTVRRQVLRVISARDMTVREQRRYRR